MKGEKWSASGVHCAEVVQTDMPIQRIKMLRMEQTDTFTIARM